MTIRLAVVSAALTVAGLLDLGPFAALPVGIAVLAASAILWLVNRSR